MTRETYTAKQLAREMGITPRQLRKFFRTRSSDITPSGRGHQYEFKAEEVSIIRNQYHNWRMNIERKKRERSSANQPPSGL